MGGEAWAGGVTWRPTTSRSFRVMALSLDRLNCRQRWGDKPCAFQMSCTLETVRPTAFATAFATARGPVPRARSRGPVRCLMRRSRKRQTGKRQTGNLGHTLRRNRRFARQFGRPTGRPSERSRPVLAARGTQNTVNTLGHEALLPAPDPGLGDPRPGHDRLRAMTIRRHPHNPAAPDMLLSRLPPVHHSLEPLAVLIRYGDGNPCAHGPVCHAKRKPGIPKRTPSFRSIH